MSTSRCPNRISPTCAAAWVTHAGEWTGVPGEQQAVLEQGKLSFVDNSVDMNTGTIQLKGLFDNRDSKLWPGQFVDTNLTLSEHPGTVLVPSQAVQTGQTAPMSSWSIDAMKAAEPPSGGRRHDRGETVIERGLTGGETVVTDGQLRLMPGGTS